MTPKVTCIISSYNRPKLIRDAIESCKDQTLKDFEVIIADDDSNREVLDVIERLILGDGRFILLKQAAGSPKREDRTKLTRYCMTINAALAISTGESICYLPDDDFWYPAAFEIRSRTLDENPDVHVVYGRLRSVSYDVESLWDCHGRPKPGRTYPKYGEIDPETGIPVNPATWQPGVLSPFGGRLDHSQIQHRRICLEEMGGPEYWPVAPANRHVGDALFFKRFDVMGHGALAIDAMVTSKRYHGVNFEKAGASDLRE